MTTCAIRFLPRRTRRLAGSALRMPAVANDRWLLADALAIVAAILAALRRRAIASRMHALFNFLLGHRNPLSCVFSCRRAYAHAHPKSIPLKLHWSRRVDGSDEDYAADGSAASSSQFLRRTGWRSGDQPRERER